VLTPVHLRDLLVEPGAHPRRQAHLSSASGLVRAGEWLYVVADDEHHLGSFKVGGAQGDRTRLHRMLPGNLPLDKARRKQLTAYLDNLVLLPARAGRRQDVLLALGSGSRANREQGVVMDLDDHGNLAGESRTVNLAGLYLPLRSTFPDLNIEGAFVGNERFHLLQRGNKGDGRNASIEYRLAEIRDWIEGGRRSAPAAIRIVQFALGEDDGVPLGFTDGAALPDGGWVFSAVAEDTNDSYRDGACAASAIGWVDASGQLQRVEPIAGAPKVEGIALAADGQLLIVTDSDDPAIASQLLALSDPAAMRPAAPWR
jgi:hypothetical protein